MHIDGQALLIIVAVVVVGWLGVVTGGANLITYLLFGTVGAFLGHYFFGGVNIGLQNIGPLTEEIFGAAIGAIVLVTIARLFLRS